MDGLSTTTAERLGWYTRRLRSMSIGEIRWRGTRLVAGRLPRRSLAVAPDTRLLGRVPDWGRALADFRAAAGRPVLLDRDRAREVAARHPDHVAELVENAERVRAGHVAYFGYPEVCLASPIDWNHDPVHDVRWPLLDASRIDHRTAAGDPKWIWELNRLQHLPWLAQAWLFTGESEYAEVALTHLDTWIDQNPVGRGIAWRGAFEAGIRAISVATALQGLRDYDGLTPVRFERVVRVLAASAERCWRDRSLYSSANNHLVGELAGLATVALLLPDLAASPVWEHRAIRGLTAEADRQILPDGAGAEQAVGYQVFTAELFLVVAALLASRGERPPAPLLAAIDRSADYLAAVVGDADPAPRYGDDDEGFALRLGPEPRRTVRDHLGSVAALTGNPRAARAGTPTLTSSWLELVVQGSGTPSSPLAQASARSSLVVRGGSVHAPDGGLVVLRSAGRRITMDVAPLGYLAIAAHGHADALAVTVSLDGEDVIGHPGAASYYGHPEWRSVHRSTRAHPTVSVDGQDQSVVAGPFMWTRHARVRVRAVDLERGVVDAEHDGYTRLAEPVTHRRWLFAPPDDPAFLVVDEVAGGGVHEVRTSWPLHPTLDVTQVPQGHLVGRRGTDVLQVLTAANSGAAGHEAPVVRVEQVRGDTASHLGWWSDRLESREPSWSIGSVVRGATPVLVATLISRAGGEHAVSDLAVVADGDTISCAWRAGPGGRPLRVVIDRSRPGAVEQRPAVAAV